MTRKKELLRSKYALYILTDKHICRRKEPLSSKYALRILTSKHICRNNSRDHLVDSDWVHMFTHVTEHLNNTALPIKKSTEAISYATVSKYARQELTHRKFEKFLSLDSGHRRGNTVKAKRKSEGSFD